MACVGFEKTARRASEHTDWNNVGWRTCSDEPERFLRWTGRPVADVLHVQSFVEDKALFHLAVAFRAVLRSIAHFILSVLPTRAGSGDCRAWPVGQANVRPLTCVTRTKLHQFRRPSQQFHCRFNAWRRVRTTNCRNVKLASA